MLTYEIDSGVSKIGFSIEGHFYYTWFHGKWSWFWKARNISDQPDIFLASQKYFWSARNMSGRPEIFLVGQKYFWSARNIGKYINTQISFFDLGDHRGYSGSTGSCSGGEHEGKYGFLDGETEVVTDTG